MVLLVCDKETLLTNKASVVDLSLPVIMLVMRMNKTVPLRLTEQAASLPSGAALPVCAMLAAGVRREPGLQPLCAPLLLRLLPLTVEALPSYETRQLLQLMSSLVVLEHVPAPNWQAMWFTTMRSRLPLLQVRMEWD
jgi:hypothetical protein